jgi:DNA-binding LytR/AlgR family response regulator
MPEAGDSGIVDTARPPLALRPAVDGERLRVVGRRRADLIFIDATDIWAFEAADRLTFVHCKGGRFDLDVSLTELETLLGPGLLRPHRNWLVYSAHVREWRRRPERPVLVVGALDGTGLEVPVAPERLPALRSALLAGAVGLRRRPLRAPAEGEDTKDEPTTPIRPRVAAV